MKDLAIIVPTRGRPSNIEDLLFSLQETNTASDLWLVLDDDDPELDHYTKLNNALIFPREGKGMAKPLNKAAMFLLDDYRHFAFLGDDHRPRTDKWDQFFIKELDLLGTGLVYGNDLLQGENLPTAVAMTGDIVRELKGMVPPGLIHLYLDNFWMQLGKDLGAFSYLGHVILEHLHPIAGKAEWDEGYKAVNADDVYSADAKAFHQYITGEDYQNLLKALS
jgi:hypothetical protein